VSLQRLKFTSTGSPDEVVSRQFAAWFKKESDTVVRSTLRAVPAAVPAPFLNHASIHDREKVTSDLRLWWPFLRQCTFPCDLIDRGLPGKLISAQAGYRNRTKDKSVRLHGLFGGLLEAT
jgi:hypothetical protein